VSCGDVRRAADERQHDDEQEPYGGFCDEAYLCSLLLTERYDAPCAELPFVPRFWHGYAFLRGSSLPSQSEHSCHCRHPCH